MTESLLQLMQLEVITRDSLEYNPKIAMIPSFCLNTYSFR